VKVPEKEKKSPPRSFVDSQIADRQNVDIT
jgi:hypothetical protein